MKPNNQTIRTALVGLPQEQLLQVAVEAIERLVETEEVSQWDNGSFFWPTCGETLGGMPDMHDDDEEEDSSE